MSIRGGGLGLPNLGAVSGLGSGVWGIRTTKKKGEIATFRKLMLLHVFGMPLPVHPNMHSGQHGEDAPHLHKEALDPKP